MVVKLTGLFCGLRFAVQRTAGRIGGRDVEIMGKLPEARVVDLLHLRLLCPVDEQVAHDPDDVEGEQREQPDRRDDPRSAGRL